MRHRYSIADMHECAEKRGGKCLSLKYVNARSPLLWECENGHRWSAEPRSVTGGSWCRRCFYDRRAAEQRLDLPSIKSIAERRGGKCLAESYNNVDTKIAWECAFGHRWDATVSDIKRGRWCPKCSTGQAERICREFFERLFCESFPTQRPSWLRNSRGNRMELDGYCERLRLAFEHQGEQHYSARTRFVKSSEALQSRMADDKRKSELCEENGVTLICVPEIGGRLPLNDVGGFIIKECRRLGVDIPCPNGAPLDEVLDAAFKTNQDALELELLRRIAKNQGGKCLSDRYQGTWGNLEWECSEGHRWHATPNNIKQGTWCSICSGNLQKSLADMHRLAEARGGKCLSQEYLNNKANLVWVCAEGHRWETSAGNVHSGKWCPVCGIRKRSHGRRSTIRDMRNLAGIRSGKCLSEYYTNAKTKLLWECSKGHRWKATPSDVKQGRWCPTCGRIRGHQKQALSIDEMKSLALEREGRCLSQTYINVKTHLEWECSRGHRWKAIPESVRRGSWCPVCARQKSDGSSCDDK